MPVFPVGKSFYSGVGNFGQPVPGNRSTISYLKLIGKIVQIVTFVKNFPESSIHVFCECDIIKFIWNELVKIFRIRKILVFQFQILKMFGIYKDNFLTYLFLCVKYILCL